MILNSETRQRDEGNIGIVWIDYCTGDVVVGNNTSATEAINFREWICSGRRSEDLPVLQANDANVVVSGRDTDCAYFARRCSVASAGGGERRLGYDRHAIATIGRSVEAIGTEVKRVRRPRPQSHGRVEEHDVVKIDAIGRYSCRAIARNARSAVEERTDSPPFP